MSKRKRDSDDHYAAGTTKPTVTGYSLDVSPLKRLRNNRMYFDGEIQTAPRETKRVVCFSPEKQHKFVNAKTSKQAVNLTKANLSPSLKGEIDVLVNNDTVLEIASQPVAFKFNAKAKNSQRRTNNASDLASLVTPGETVSVTAKVLSMDPAEHSVCFGKNLLRAEIVVVDHTRQIRLTLLGQSVGKVEQDKSYLFKNVTTRLFRGEFKMTTSPKSEITETNDVPNVQELEVETPEVIVTKLEFVSASVVKKCGNCLKAINDEFIGDVDTTCPHCSIFMQNSSLRSSTTVKINIQDKRLTAFDPCIRAFLNDVQKTDLMLLGTDLSRYLISLPQIRLVVKNNVICSMGIPQPEPSVSIEG